MKYNTDKIDDKGLVYCEVDDKKYPVEYAPTIHEKDAAKRIFNSSASIIVGKVKLDAGTHQLKLTPGEYQGVQIMRPLSLTLNSSGK